MQAERNREPDKKSDRDSPCNMFRRTGLPDKLEIEIPICLSPEYFHIATLAEMRQFAI